MRRNVACLLSLSILSAAVCACAPFSPSDQRAGLCNEINSKLIFSGSTSNQRESNIQNSERAFLQRSYEKDNCDK